MSEQIPNQPPKKPKLTREPFNLGTGKPISPKKKSLEVVSPQEDYSKLIEKFTDEKTKKILDDLGSQLDKYETNEQKVSAIEQLYAQLNFTETPEEFKDEIFKLTNLENEHKKEFLELHKAKIDLSFRRIIVSVLDSLKSTKKSLEKRNKATETKKVKKKSKLGLFSSSMAIIAGLASFAYFSSEDAKKPGRESEPKKIERPVATEKIKNDIKNILYRNLYFKDYLPTQKKPKVETGPEFVRSANKIVERFTREKVDLVSMEIKNLGDNFFENLGDYITELDASVLTFLSREQLLKITPKQLSLLSPSQWSAFTKENLEELGRIELRNEGVKLSEESFVEIIRSVRAYGLYKVFGGKGKFYDGESNRETSTIEMMFENTKFEDREKTVEKVLSECNLKYGVNGTIIADVSKLLNSKEIVAALDSMTREDIQQVSVERFGLIRYEDLLFKEPVFLTNLSDEQYKGLSADFLQKISIISISQIPIEKINLIQVSAIKQLSEGQKYFLLARPDNDGILVGKQAREILGDKKFLEITSTISDKKFRKTLGLHPTKKEFYNYSN